MEAKSTTTNNNRLYNQLKNQDDESRALKKSLLLKSFSNTKDNRGNCAMEQSEFLKKQKEEGKRAMFKLLLVTGLCFVFMGGEIVGGYLSGSLAIITDAAHMLSDVAGFLISYFAIYMGSRPANY
jgi:Co/Zn/Cd efflux system component